MKGPGATNGFTGCCSEIADGSSCCVLTLPSWFVLSPSPPSWDGAPATRPGIMGDGAGTVTPREETLLVTGIPLPGATGPQRAGEGAGASA